MFEMYIHRVNATSQEKKPMSYHRVNHRVHNIANYTEWILIVYKRRICICFMCSTAVDVSDIKCFVQILT